MSPEASLIDRAAILLVQAEGIREDLELDPSDNLTAVSELAELLAELVELVAELVGAVAVTGDRVVAGPPV